MHNFFQKNLPALSRHTTCRLPDALPDNITAQTTQSGEVTIKYGNLLIHSAYDPVKEGHSLAKNVALGSWVCLYGFGLGYHVEAILNKIGPDGTLLVIELNPDLLASAMILRDLTTLLSDKRLRLVFGEQEEQVAAEISHHMDLSNHSTLSQAIVLFHSPSLKCIPKHFERITNALEILQMERRVPAIFGDLERDNYLANKEIADRSSGIIDYRDAHKSQPAILVSAGPSLDDIIPYLKRIEGHCILSCVDTALPILSREDISPRYVFTLDPQDDSFLYFIDDLEHPAKLVYIPTANAKVVRFYKGEKIVVIKEGHALFENTTLPKEKGTTPAGGSVSCLGIDCLIQMGCNPIILAGQDCAFSGNLVYSRYATINDHLRDRVGAWNTLANLNSEKMREQKMIEVENLDGGKIFTNQMMYSYLRNIEQMARAHPKIKIHNLRTHGARIENLISLGSINDIMTLLQPL